MTKRFERSEMNAYAQAACAAFSCSDRLVLSMDSALLLSIFVISLISLRVLCLAGLIILPVIGLIIRLAPILRNTTCRATNGLFPFA